MPLPNYREQQLAEALKAAQLEKNRLEQRQRQLEAEVAKLRAQVAQLQAEAKKARKSKSAQDSEDDNDNEGRPPHYNKGKIRRLGKMYLVAGELWICPRPEDAVGKPLPPDISLDDPQRFLPTASPEYLLPWVIAELYALIPEKYHEMLAGYAPFARNFIKGYNDMRSTAISSIRTHAALIFNLRPDWVDRFASIDKAHEPALLRYLKRNPNSSKYDEFPPLLYPNCVADRPDLTFQNPQLVDVLKVVLWGPKSLRGGDDQSQPEPSGRRQRRKSQGTARSTSTPPTNAHLWGLQEVTPGMIAFSAVAATFILSADQEFVPVGKVTGIKYWDRYRQYKKVLVTTISHPSTKATMDFFQARLFPGRQVLRENHESDHEDAADAFIQQMMGSRPDETDILSRGPTENPVITFDAESTYEDPPTSTVEAATRCARPHQQVTDSIRYDSQDVGDHTIVKTRGGRAVRSTPVSYTRSAPDVLAAPVSSTSHATHTAYPSPSSQAVRSAPDAPAVHNSKQARILRPSVADARAAAAPIVEQAERRPSVAPRSRVRVVSPQDKDESGHASSDDSYSGLPSIIELEEDQEGNDPEHPESDVDEVGYYEIDPDEQTDEEALGQIMDLSFDDVPAPVRSVNVQAPVGLPIAPTQVPRRDYSHRPNAPPVIQSLQTAALPLTGGPREVFDPTQRRVPTNMPIAHSRRVVSSPVPGNPLHNPMPRSFSGTRVSGLNSADARTYPAAMSLHASTTTFNRAVQDVDGNIKVAPLQEINSIEHDLNTTEQLSVRQRRGPRPGLASAGVEGGERLAAPSLQSEMPAQVPRTAPSRKGKKATTDSADNVDDTNAFNNTKGENKKTASTKGAKSAKSTKSTKKTTQPALVDAIEDVQMSTPRKKSTRASTRSKRQ